MTHSGTPSSKQAPQRNRRGAFSLLFTALLAIGAGNTMLIAAVIPFLTRQLEMPDWTAGAIFSLSAAVWTFCSPYWGRKSSEIGRRPVVAIGLLGYAVSMGLLGMVGWLALEGYIQGVALILAGLLFARSLFGMIGSGTSPAAQAYVADRTSPENRTQEIASVTAGFSVGTVAGPAFAATLSAMFGLLSPVFFACGLAAIMSFLVFRYLPENTPPQKPDDIKPKNLPGAKGLWRHPKVLPFLIYAVGLSLVTGVLTQSFIFAVIDKLASTGIVGVEANQYAAPAFMMGAVGTLLAQLVLIPRLQLSNRAYMVVGAIVLAIGAFMIIPAQAFAVLVTAQFLVGVGQGLSRPGFSSGASLAVGPELQGNVAGLVIAANGMGFIVSPFFGPFLYEFVHPALPFALAGAMLLALSVFAHVSVKNTPAQEDLV